MGGAGDLRHFARQGAHALLQRLLLAGQGLGPLRRLERQRARLSGPRGGRPRTAGRGVTRALLRQRARALAQGALLRRERIGRRRRVLRRLAGRGPQLVEARQAQRVLHALAAVRHGRVIPGVHAQPQRVPRQQAAGRGVEVALHDGALPHAAHVERLPQRLPRLPGAAHAPAHELQPRQAVVVARVHDERLAQRQGERRVPARQWHEHHGRRIGDHAQLELRRRALERSTVRRGEVEPPRPRGRRKQPAREAGSLHGEP